MKRGTGRANTQVKAKRKEKEEEEHADSSEGEVYAYNLGVRESVQCKNVMIMDDHMTMKKENFGTFESVQNKKYIKSADDNIFTIRADQPKILLPQPSLSFGWPDQK